MTDPNPEILDPNDPDLTFTEGTLDPERPNLRLASAVVLDHERRALFIDGVEFPWYLHQDGPTVEPNVTDESEPPTFVVHLPVICETYDVVGEPGA